MIEREPRPPSNGPEVPSRPPYERISAGLERLLAATGWVVREGFPVFVPKGSMSAFDHAERTLTLHPWIAPRARAEVLLREAVKRLSDPRATKRGKAPAEEPRDWLVQGLVAKQYGLEVDERDVSKLASWRPTLAEDLLIKRIVGAIEGPPPVSDPAERPTNGDGPSATSGEPPTPQRPRAGKRPAEGSA